MDTPLREAPDGALLAHLCFFIEDTPVIEQMAGIALHVAAGEEQEIINTANLISFEPGAAEHPAFAEKRIEERARMRPPGESPVVDENGEIVPNESRAQDMIRARNDAYFSATGAIWIEAVGVTALGARGYKIMREHVGA